MFRITFNRGFQMTFSNGWTVNVQFGAANHCSNRSHDLKTNYIELVGKGPNRECTNAEIAAWDAYIRWHQFENDQVKGYCSTDEVAAFISMIAAKPEDKFVVTPSVKDLEQQG